MKALTNNRAYAYNRGAIFNMKYMSTTTIFSKITKRTLLILTVLVVGVVMPIATFTTVRADDYDARIKAIESEISGYQSEASRLADQAATLKTAVDKLTAQKNTIQAQVDLSQAKYDKLVAEIAANEKKLAQSQDVLTSIISTMVAQSQASPIEILASSSSVGDYVITQDRLSSVQGQLQGSITEITALKEELSKQKVAAEKVLKDQKAQRDALAAKEAEQAKLLADTKGQEASYNNLIKKKNSQIDDLRAQQAAANAAASGTYNVSNLTSGGSRCGGYPAVWCNAYQDSLVDNWGMYNRECVSYTAWKVAATGRYMPYWGGRGNANQWPSSARADGIATGSQPRVGSVAIMYVGYYGHSMYVERINANGTIHVSQFNWGVRGEYSEMDIAPSGLTFIYF